MIIREVEPYQLRKLIDQSGYAIAKNILDVKILNDIRSTILSEIETSKISDSVVWSPYIGENNKLTYSNDEFQCMYRGYVFPWNNENKLFNNVLSEVDTLRNLVFPEMGHATIGKYSTYSVYRNNEGFLKGHKDSISSDVSVFQFIVPLSDKGSDFEEGGLYIIDSTGEKINIDEKIGLGDILFFDGRYEHGVDLVKGSGVGRIQMFSIPTNFIRPEDSPRLLDQISTRKFLRHKIRNLRNRWKRK
tara:strand:+ start:57 stop:794 length:738 start_codon:yes stop_codon:yes gene_type:complete